MKKTLLACCIIPFSLFSQSENGWVLFSADGGVSSNHYWGLSSPPHIGSIVKDPSQLNNNSLDAHYYTLPNESGMFGELLPSQNFYLQAGFTPKNEHQVLNFNISYSINNHSSFGLAEVTTTIVDSMTISHSSGFQQTYFLDSMLIKRDIFSHSLQNISVGADYLFRTKQRMLTAYTGGGLQLGISLVSTVTNYYSESYAYRYVDSSGYTAYPFGTMYTQSYGEIYYDEYYLDGSSESLRGKTAFTVTPYIPLGIEIRPFIERKWLGRIGIDLNGKVGADIRFMSGASTYIRPFFNLGIGLKYFFQETFNIN